MLISPVAKNVLDIARSNHWHFRVLESVGEINSPVRIGDWVYSEADASIIPADSKKRIMEILKSGHNPTQLIMGHELLPQLPERTTPSIVPMIVPKVKELMTSPEVKRAVVIGGKVAVEAVKLAAVIGIGSLYVLGMVATALVSADPSVIVVLEDGTWIEVMNWHE